MPKCTAPHDPADLLESSNHAAELALRAHHAVVLASTLAHLFAVSVDGVEHVSRGAQALARDLAEADRVACAVALAEAARLVDAADPLGSLDDEETLRDLLCEARERYHEAVAALGCEMAVSA